MFFTRAKDEIFAALDAIDSETGLRAKQARPTAPRMGDTFVQSFSADRDATSGAFLLGCTVYTFLSQDEAQVMVKADEWSPILYEALTPVLYVQRLEVIQLGVESQPNGWPALAITGVRE